MPRDPQNLVVLTTVPSEIEGAMIIAALEQEGLEAEGSGALTAGFRAEAPGVVKILVREKDFAEAQALLAELRDSNAEIDWDQVDFGRPETRL